MKKILIISYLFAPENVMGAIRPTKLAKYLSKKKYIVTVVSTSNKKKFDRAFENDISDINQIIELEHSEMLSNKVKLNEIKQIVPFNPVLTRKNKKKKVSFKKLRYFKRQFLDFKISFDFFKQFQKAVSNGDIKINDFDYLITTYGPTSSILIGLWVKKNYPKLIWINDFRDPMVVEDTPFIFRNIYKWLQLISCDKADRIVAVSNGYLRRICGERHQEKSFVLTNGFDIDDISQVNDLVMRKKLSFVYAGSLYEGKRDVSPLFLILKELIDSNKIDINDLEFNYAGFDFRVLEMQAIKYGLESIIVNHGHLPREKCLELQNNSTFLILCTWNSVGEEGVLPGKIFEYMLMNKPIIALINGNMSKSEVSTIINNANLGIAYEQVNHFTDYELFKKYIIEQYENLKKNKDIEYKPNRNIVDAYNYANITDEFEKRCLNVE